MRIGKGPRWLSGLGPDEYGESGFVYGEGDGGRGDSGGWGEGQPTAEKHDWSRGKGFDMGDWKGIGECLNGKLGIIVLNYRVWDVHWLYVETDDAENGFGLTIPLDTTQERTGKERRVMRSSSVSVNFQIDRSSNEDNLTSLFANSPQSGLPFGDSFAVPSHWCWSNEEDDGFSHT